MIRIDAVKHTYGNTNLIFKDWQIEQGTHWLLLGDSGSGKTTLINIMAGLLKPQSGSVTINDTALYGLSNSRLDKFRGRHIGIVFQKPHLIKSLTVAENLRIAQRFAGLKENQDRISRVLASLNIDHKAHNLPATLSQGQLQRVAIARAVINQPEVLIADEPTSSLDDGNAAAVLELLINQSNINGSTLVVSTHDKRVKERLINQYNLNT